MEIIIGILIITAVIANFEGLIDTLSKTFDNE